MHKNINRRNESLSRCLSENWLSCCFIMLSDYFILLHSKTIDLFPDYSRILSDAEHLVHDDNSFEWSLSCGPCNTPHWIPGALRRVQQGRGWDSLRLLHQCGLSSGPACFFWKLKNISISLGCQSKCIFLRST